MSIFLILQASYQTYEVGLFNEDKCIERKSDDKKYSSRDLIPTINFLLTNSNLILKDIAAIGINQGPGPFTSLRIIVTTANGLSFATGIPLIGINSIEALLDEYKDLQWPLTVVLLNAFNNDLYYGIQADTLEIGCDNYSILFENLKKRFDNYPLRFLGNGVKLFKNELRTIFGNNAYIPDPLPEDCSLQQLACNVATLYAQKKSLQDQLLPIYLKNMRYTVQI